MENKLRTDYVLCHNRGKLSFPSLELLESYVNRAHELIPELDLSTAKVFKVDIFQLDKTF